jgi:AraC-like DNA-binding protein
MVARMSRNTYLLFKKIEHRIAADPSLSLRALSATFGVDRHIIEHAVREHAGSTFRELKKGARLKRALVLLSHERHGSHVKEIAAAVGLTPNARSRFIRSATGCSATELRSSKL